ncbi:MAG: DUF4845 domain-containing protein [Gammaproteobacteria bacterium]|nr:DUF4845 domain-containing protein [Gammaproteobacteria bacterium]
MRTLKFRQRGVSLSGLIFMSVLLGAVAMLLMRLFPLYNEKMKVDLALDKIVEDSASGNQTKPELVRAIMKQFEVSDVDRWSTPEFSRLLKIERDRESGSRTMSLDYEIRNAVCCTLDIVMNYHYGQDLPQGSAE